MEYRVAFTIYADCHADDEKQAEERARELIAEHMGGRRCYLPLRGVMVKESAGTELDP